MIAAHRRKLFTRYAQRRGWFDISGDDEREVARRVPTSCKIFEMTRAQASHRRRRTDHGPTIRMGNERGAVQTLRRGAQRIIGVVANFLEDHRAFTIDIGTVPARCDQGIGHARQASFEARAWQHRMKDGVIERSPCIDVAADGFDRGCQANAIGGRSAAFEHHMFEEMRDAEFIGTFVGGPSRDPRLNCHDARTRPMLVQHRQARADGSRHDRIHENWQHDGNSYRGRNAEGIN